MIDGRKSSYSSKVNCPDTGYEEIYAGKGKHPYVRAVVVIIKRYRRGKNIPPLLLVKSYVKPHRLLWGSWRSEPAGEKAATATKPVMAFEAKSSRKVRP